MFGLAGMIDLQCCVAVVAQREKMKNYSHIFNLIMSNMSVHHLVAISEEERDDWVSTLNDFIFDQPKVS